MKVAPRERVQLYLAGTLGSSTVGSVSDFLHQLTGLRPTSVELLQDGSGEAMLEGQGAYSVAAKIEGQRCDADRAFD